MYERFRIMECRGAYRVEAEVASTNTTCEPEVCGTFKKTAECRRETSVNRLWLPLGTYDHNPDAATTNQRYQMSVETYILCRAYNKSQFNISEFPSFDEAEQFVREHFGASGVSRIIKPEWRAV